MTDDEFDSPDEWQQLADACVASLTAASIFTELRDVSLIDDLNQGDWPMLLEYAKFLPVYSILLRGSIDAELAIVAAKLPERRLNIMLPAEPFNARYFNEVRDEFIIGMEHARLFGIVRMANDPGDLHIEPKTTGTELADAFTRQSLNIDGFREFTRHHHFECSDTDVAEQVLTPDFFSLIDELGDLWLDVHDGILLVGLKTRATTDQAVALAQVIVQFATPTVA